MNDAFSNYFFLHAQETIKQTGAKSTRSNFMSQFRYWINLMNHNIYECRSEQTVDHCILMSIAEEKCGRQMELVLFLNVFNI
jgi:predicted nucleic acid-binding Zn finger protein